MEPIALANQTCENCEYQRDKGPQHCPTCGEGTLSNWTEAGWHREERADAQIAVLMGALEESARDCQGLRNVARCADCESVASCLTPTALSSAAGAAKKLLARLKGLESLLSCDGRHCNTCEHYQVADDSYGESLGTVCVHEHGKACREQDPDEGGPLPQWQRRKLKCEW
jgi:hypothetical protein